MEDIGLIFLGVFVDFALSEVSEGVVSVDEVRDAVQDDFVLIFAGGVVEGFFSGLDGPFSNDSGFLDISNVEENACVPKLFFVAFGPGDGDFVDFHGASEERLYDPFNLLLQIFIIEIFGLILLDLGL